MKTFLLASLVALLCLQPAQSLMCFTCNDASSNWACMTPATCPDDANYCVTTYFGASLGQSSGQSISKGCSSVCPSAGINIGIAAASVSCCSSSLCNISGASSVRVSYSVMAIAILTSFICIFRARL
uniref:UPAR/Ly6 domain-containing protein n=1 Tax=Pelusios castaneus TaxID=367368 RepID=A0A8C8RGV6_9SAUR